MIAILLVTYNGELYLREQIDSLLQQTNNNFLLYIRDDGSMDMTLEIINEYISKYSNIVLCEDVVTHRGACGGFLWLLEHVEADYYMFCDQDDIWMPFKVAISYDVMQSEEFRYKNEPILIHTDLTVTDRFLKMLYPSLWEHDKTIPSKIGRKYLCLVNYITGCTTLFNRKARDLAIVEYGSAIMHDHWLGICVDAVNGRIVSLPISTIFYRQHGNNVIGASNVAYRFPKLRRYFHSPDYAYSRRLYRMLNAKYHISIYGYLFKKIVFFLSF